MKKFLRNMRGVAVFAMLTLNTIFWFVPIFVLALFKLAIPVNGVRRAITRSLMWMGEVWISFNTAIWSGSGSAQWQISSTVELDRSGWYLVIANHQTWVDIVVLQAMFNRRIPFLKFFIKQELVWFPFLGVAWWALDMPFMKRYSPSYLSKNPHMKGKDLEATRRACEKFRDTPTSVINFLEGTRFSEEKRARRQSPYQHLLVPRAGGVAVALGSMGQLFDAVLDVTLHYPDGVPQFWGLCCGDQVPVVAEVTKRPIDPRLLQGNYQEDRDFRRYVHNWLASIWEEKDRRLATWRNSARD